MKDKEKLISYAYLHDLFTSVLTYDRRRVKEILKEKFPKERLITKFKVYMARKEFPLIRKYQDPSIHPFYYADVVWFALRSSEEKGSIVHEVKTGKEWKYAWIRFSNTQTIFHGYPIVPEHENTIYCLWIWKRFYDEEPDHPPWVKICFLDWIQPIISERLKPIKDIIMS